MSRIEIHYIVKNSCKPSWQVHLYTGDSLRMVFTGSTVEEAAAQATDEIIGLVKMLNEATLALTGKQTGEQTDEMTVFP